MEDEQQSSGLTQHLEWIIYDAFSIGQRKMWQQVA